MTPLWGSFVRILVAIPVLALVGCEVFRSPAPNSSTEFARSDVPSVDLLFADSTLPVQIDATHLFPGDYYGSITITDASPESTPISVRVLARVAPGLNDAISGLGADADGEPAYFGPARETDSDNTQEPEWILPPPAEMESGVEYTVEFTKARSATGESLSTDVRASSKEDGSVGLSQNSSSIQGADPTRAKEKITLLECQSKQGYLALEWYDGNKWHVGVARPVQVLRPKAPTPEVYIPDNFTRTIQSITRQYVGKLVVSSLCGIRMPWSISHDTWLEITPRGGTIEEGDSISTVLEVFTAANVETGFYSGAVTVTAAESGRSKSITQYLSVVPVRLSWLDQSPLRVQSGEEIILRISPMGGYAPRSVWVEPTPVGSDGSGYNPDKIIALPMPDGTFTVPLRLIACRESRFRVSTWGGISAYSSFSSNSEGGSIPIEITVSPVEKPVLSISPTVLILDAVSGEKSPSRDLRLDFACRGGGKRLKVAPSHSWIQLAPAE